MENIDTDEIIKDFDSIRKEFECIIICGSENLETNITKNITEKGMLILKYMASNKDLYNNVFTSQLIGAGMQLTGRSVSGSMRKLVSEGYVNKLDAKPIAYQITEQGMQKALEACN